MLCLILIGCSRPAVNFLYNFNNPTWCNAQYDKIVLNGHITNISNWVTNETIKPCCCYGTDEYICVCAVKEKEITKKLFKEGGK